VSARAADVIPRAVVRRLRPEQEHTDVGNARRLVELHGQDLRHDHVVGAWLLWDGQRWAADTTGELDRRAKDTAAQLLHDAADASTDDGRRNAGRHALASANAGRLRAMVDLARSEPGVPVQAGDLDPDPLFLNVANGLLDLRTGHLGPHRRDALCTRMSPVEYDPQATAPTFQTFLERVLPDPDVRAFVQRLAGYALTGDASEQVLPVLVGAGANGKSTFVEILREVLGDYAATVPPDLLVTRRDGSPAPYGLIRLRGVRLATASETESGARLSTALVKQLTGGDTVTAREHYSAFVDFRLAATVVLSTNHRPVIRDTTESIWRRVRLLPFEVVIPPAERDPGLASRLKAELPGVLAWAVRGCLEWQAHGLGSACAIDAATSGYRADSDPLGGFVDEECIVSDSLSVASTALYARWSAWCGARGEQPGTASALGTRMKERGLTAQRTTGGSRVYRGLGLSTSSDVSDGSDVTPWEST